MAFARLQVSGWQNARRIVEREVSSAGPEETGETPGGPLSGRFENGGHVTGGVEQQRRLARAAGRREPREAGLLSAPKPRQRVRRGGREHSVRAQGLADGDERQRRVCRQRKERRDGGRVGN